MTVIRTTQRWKQVSGVLRSTAAARILSSHGWERRMGSVAENLKTMGAGQLFLALLFLGSYALALGKFASSRMRLVTAAGALCAAAGFAALSDPWEAGIVLIALAPVSMAVFAAAAWALWLAATWRVRALRAAPAAAECAPAETAARPLLSRLRARILRARIRFN